jgi:hypothetical protein
MFDHSAKHQRALAGLMNGLGESILTQSDEELLAETTALGENPRAAAAEVRDVLRGAAKTFRQRHLRAAAAEYQRRAASLKRGWLDLPATPGDRRAMLASVFARNPRMESAFLTVQHREFKELSDADVESCLLQLKELGVLDEGDEGDGNDD